jgi:PAS domain S-box-containing protein
VSREMPDNQYNAGYFEDLKRVAQEQAETASDNTRALSSVEKSNLIHDLKVHQIELEIQNKELRSTQYLLQETRDNYARLYNNAPVGYLTLDAAGVVRKSNRTFLQMVGREGWNPAGRPFYEFIIPEDRDSFLGRYRAFYRNPASKDMQVTLIRDGGGNLPVRLAARREDDTENRGPDERGELLLIVTDVTSQKEAEDRIHRLLAEKELLLSEIQHRVKNTLASVISMLSLQTSRLENPAAVHALEDARRRIETMTLVYDALRDTKGYKEIDLSLYLPDLVSSIQRSFPASNITVKSEIAEVTVESGTASQIGIIVNELVTNSYKHAYPDHAGGVIRVALRSGACSGYRLTVCDDGAGSGDEKEMQSDDSLGLVLVRGITEQLGGALRISPNVPTGVCFEIEIPDRKKVQ